MSIDRVLSEFVIESQENLERLDHEFVALEYDPTDEELLASIFRTIHTIKGSAGFLNLTNLEHVSHYTEDVLARLREHSLALNDTVITTLLSAVDCIKAIVVSLEKTGEEGDHEVLDVVMKLKEIGAEQQASLPEHTSVEQPATDAGLSEQQLTSASEEAFQADAPQTPQDSKLSETLARSLSPFEESRIHVDISLLDQLMNLTGELVLSRNQVVQFADSIDQRYFRGIAQRMNVVVSELQETVMKTRMQPINKVFGIFPRLVRDMAKLYGKDITLVMEGQNTELDRTLIEGIKDPLTHLVRNAIDHGIELPDIRRKFGKPATATITINAYHEGGQVHIEITDDGAGIDVEKITATAISQRLLTRQQAEEMSQRNLINLIFRPGFSTAETVTSISGRGVGMDVVKRNLERIGGIVEVQTERHQSTTFKIRIPITLAIIPALIVNVSQHRFAIPQVNLEELLMLQTDGSDDHRIERVHGAEVYRLRGELLPLLRLHEVLQLPPSEPSKTDTINIVVLVAGGLRFGLIVDEVGDSEEIVVKPLSKHVKQLHYYDGATIMGDGKVALILNISGLFGSTQLNLEEMQKAQQPHLEEQTLQQSASEADHQQTIVLFKAGDNEYYGVPLAFVIRLEKFATSQIERSGGREVMQYRGQILPLLRLEDYLDIPKPPDADQLFLIVFAVEKQIGLVVTEIVDTVAISTHIDTETFKQQGVLGSTIVQGHSVIILDIHGLIEMAYPSWYKKFFLSKLSEEERRNIRILLVEDSAFFLNIERSYLEATGYQVLTAQHGHEALEILETHPVDLVVTDIDMPVCNGYELAKTLKASDAWHHLPIMALTALSGERDRERGREAGIDEYQIKLDRDEVLRAIELLILRTRGEAL
ncbi:response regulator [candidate division KSB3 bacterium]|uniref:histidine kinase n=1 Tax=candidate division KSB3 bacterium TaxID=2044937 RepID=A0A9D5JT17_9BACT|nr:response regulator [candidate division KSB3 bacterium]MBD3323717.1 response regulator [candidate division KSB3 bacterium]